MGKHSEKQEWIKNPSVGTWLTKTSKEERSAGLESNHWKIKEDKEIFKIKNDEIRLKCINDYSDETQNIFKNFKKTEDCNSKEELKEIIENLHSAMKESAEVKLLRKEEIKRTKQEEEV